jgi:hypothetical protein
MKYLHWDYFLSLDSDLNEVSKFIEIHCDNFETYSIQLTRLYLSACSEIDVIAKLFCDVVNPGQLQKITGKRRPNMDNYRQVIIGSCPKIYKMTIDLPKYGCSVEPWRDYINDKNPSWWSDYNKVKHNRDKFFYKANLINTINALAGLFVLTVYYYAYRDTGSFSPDINFPPKVLAAEKHNAGNRFVDDIYYVPPDKDENM